MTSEFIDLRPTKINFRQAPGESWLYHFRLKDNLTGTILSLSDFIIVAEIYENDVLIETLNEESGINVSTDQSIFTIKKNWVSITDGIIEPVISTIALGVYNLKIYISSTDGNVKIPVLLNIDISNEELDATSYHDSNVLINDILIQDGFAVGLYIYDLLGSINDLIANLSSYFYESSNNPFEWSDANGNIALKIRADSITEAVGIKAKSLDTPEVTKFLDFIKSFHVSFGESSNNPFEWSDANGNIALKIRADSITEAVGIKAKSLDTPEVTKLFSFVDVLNGMVGVASANPFEFVDNFGNIVFKIDSTGKSQMIDLQIKDTVKALKLAVETDYITKKNSGSKFIFWQEDANGNIGWAINDEMKLLGLDVSECLPKRKFGFLADIVQILIDGQSLSEAAFGMPVISTVQKYNSLMFNGGAHPDFSSMTNFASFVPLVESLFAPEPTQGETVASGFSEMFYEALVGENAYSIDDNYKLLFTVSGESGKTILELGKSQAAINGYYTRNITAVQKANDIALAQGKSHQVGAILWIHGESDQGCTQEYYMGAMAQLRKDLCADIRVITKQNYDPIFLISQVASQRTTYMNNNVSIAQLRASTSKSNIVLAETSYQTPYYTGDYIHKIAPSYKKMGAAFGYVFKKMMIDGEEWLPLYIKDYSVQGNVIQLEYHVPKGGLVLDTTLVSNPGTYGFNLYSASGVAIAITSVSITRKNTIKIVAASSITRYCKLQYANPPGISQAGPTTGVRGNVRDQSGDSVILHGSNLTDPVGFVYAVHRWAAIQDIVFQTI